MKAVYSVLVFGLLLLTACSQSVEDHNQFTDCKPGIDARCMVPVDEKADVDVRIFTTQGNVDVGAELVNTGVSRSLGLMYRESLGKDSGMLFDFVKESKAPFWMKNTLIPLDIIFVDRFYKIIYIEENAQPCKEEPCPLYGPDDWYLFVLEVNGGFSAKHGIEVGQSMSFTLP